MFIIKTFTNDTQSTFLGRVGEFNQRHLAAKAAADLNIIFSRIGANAYAEVAEEEE